MLFYMTTKTRFRALVVTPLAAVFALAAWQTASPLQAQRTLGSVPSGSALIDFRVVGSDGKPVTDLKPEDVTIGVDGRNRVIQALRIVQIGDGGATSALPAPFGTNVLPEGQRNVMVLFNDASIRAGQESDVKAATSRFVSTLGSNDAVGLMTTPRGSIRIDPTTDRGVFNAGLEKVVGQAAPMETAEDFTCKTREVLDELRGLFGSLGAQTTPTYVLFFSAGLAAPVTSAAQLRESSACELRVDSYQNLAGVAAAARVQMYVLQPEGLTTSRPGDEGLESLAGVTGSRRYWIGSSGQSVLDQIAVETSAYYVATVALEDVERNGQPHRLDVAVARPDTRTLAHSQIVLGAPSPEGRGGRGGRGGAPPAPSPRDMLRTVAQFRDLPLRVGGVASRLDPSQSKLKVIAMMQPIEAVTLTAASAALIKGDRLVSQWTAQPEELGRELVFAALTADPGKYRLRMAATDSTGRAGAADYEIDVSLHAADTTQVSGVWTFSNASGQMAPVLQYSDEESAIAYFELYGQPPPNFFARLELARTMDGEAIAAPQLQAAPGAQGSGMFMITGQIPLAALEPGDYVIRLTLGTDPRATLVRTLRKVQ